MKLSKPFLEKMSKEERQAFGYLENLIQKSKIECLSNYPKILSYNDTAIQTDLNVLFSKIDKIEKRLLELNELLTLTQAIEIKESFNKNIEIMGNRQKLLWGYLVLIQKLAEKEFLGMEFDDDFYITVKKVIKDNHKMMNEIMEAWEENE